MRACFAGEVAPQVIFPTLTGRYRQWPTSSDNENLKTVFIGDDVLENKNMFFLRHPIEFGTITNCDDMELIWRYILHDELHSPLDDHSILLTEQILSLRSGREKATMMFFEEFNVPGRSALVCWQRSFT
jgi:actin-related protein